MKKMGSMSSTSFAVMQNATTDKNRIGFGIAGHYDSNITSSNAIS
jgi:hypothetical protein